MENERPDRQRAAENFGAWEDERQLELREKRMRGEELTHEEKLSLALDEVGGP